MTDVEFLAQRDSLRCQHCGAGDLTLQSNANNGGIRPVCAGCGSIQPIPGVQWLRQVANRTVRRFDYAPTAEEVWEANGNHCAFCGKSREVCQRYNIGLSRQHIVPVVFGGNDGPLVPFCARCQEMSAAQVKLTMNITSEAGLTPIFKRMEERHPELRGDD